MFSLRSSTPIEKLPEALRALARQVDALPSAVALPESDRDGRVSADEAFKARYYQNRFDTIRDVPRDEILELERIVSKRANSSLQGIATFVGAVALVLLMWPYMVVTEAAAAVSRRARGTANE